MKSAFEIEFFWTFAFKLKKLNYAVGIEDKVVIFDMKIAKLFCIYLRSIIIFNF